MSVWRNKCFVAKQTRISYRKSNNGIGEKSYCFKTLWWLEKNSLIDRPISPALKGGVYGGLDNKIPTPRSKTLRRGDFYIVCSTLRRRTEPGQTVHERCHQSYSILPLYWWNKNRTLPRSWTLSGGAMDIIHECKRLFKECLAKLAPFEHIQTTEEDFKVEWKTILTDRLPTGMISRRKEKRSLCCHGPGG